MPCFKSPVVLGLAALAVSSLVVGEGAWAGPPRARAPAAPKAQKPAVVATDVQPAGQAAEEAPIVMGRSVGVVRRSKLQHIKAKPVRPVVAHEN